MKTHISTVFAAVALLTLLSFAACNKTETASPVEINTELTANISGIIKAPLEINNDPDGTEYAPSGTKVFLKVEKRDLNPQAPAGEFFIFETTVGTGGTYSYDVPTTKNGVDVTIMPDDFVYNQKIWSYDYVEDLWTSETERKIFTTNPQAVNTIAGQTRIIDFYYQAN